MLRPWFSHAATVCAPNTHQQQQQTNCGSEKINKYKVLQFCLLWNPDKKKGTIHMDAIYYASSKVLRQSIREDARLVFSRPAAVLSPNKICVAPAYAAHLSERNVICRSAEWAVCAQFPHRYKCDYNSPLQRRTELEVVRVKWHQGFLQFYDFMDPSHLSKPWGCFDLTCFFFSKIKWPSQTKSSCWLFSLKYTLSKQVKWCLLPVTVSSAASTVMSVTFPQHVWIWFSPSAGHRCARLSH